jgi:hypothetical protein
MSTGTGWDDVPINIGSGEHLPTDERGRREATTAAYTICQIAIRTERAFHNAGPRISRGPPKSRYGYVANRPTSAPLRPRPRWGERRAGGLSRSVTFEAEVSVGPTVPHPAEVCAHDADGAC